MEWEGEGRERGGRIDDFSGPIYVIIGYLCQVTEEGMRFGELEKGGGRESRPGRIGG